MIRLMLKRSKTFQIRLSEIDEAMIAQLRDNEVERPNPSRAELIRRLIQRAHREMRRRARLRALEEEDGCFE